MVLAILSNVSLHGFLKKVPSWDHFYLDPTVINWDMVSPNEASLLGFGWIWWFTYFNGNSRILNWRYRFHIRPIFQA